MFINVSQVKKFLKGREKQSSKEFETALDKFEEVAERRGLPPVIKERYIKYMRTRWANEEETQCLTGYAMEWANRFLIGDEYGASDIIGHEVLEEIDK